MSTSQQYAPGAAGETIRPVAELFTTAATGFWATTYSIDLPLFAEFLLGRLGEPPLNIVILADHQRLSAGLARVPADRADTLASANRRWLLRGVSLGGQAFHPKTYLAVTASRAALFVGSGNLTLDGIDAGDELFTVFRSGTPAGDAALGTWRAWMRRIIEITEDPVVADRFRDLEARLPQPSATSVTASPLLHNLDAPIASQLADRVHAVSHAVDELLLAAPFYDHDAAALGDLLAQLAPAKVHVFVTSATSVNGALLAGRLASSGATVTVSGYQPDRFIHAKLIGVISGTRGWLLSGSPNLSQAALTRTIVGNGNAELAVIATCTPSAARAAFIPPDTEVTERSLTDLDALSFRADSEPGLPAVRLHSAASTADGYVTLVSDPPPQPGWLLDDQISRQPVTVSPVGQAITAGPLAGRLVQLADTSGQVLSNRVVVDDPAALAAVLATGPDIERGDRPPELAATDLDSPLARTLVWLHRNLVMDVSETVAGPLAQPVTGDEASMGSDDSLWERLDKERLARDPRAGIYPTLWGRDGTSSTEPVIALLETLRDQAPAMTGDPGGSPLAHLVRLARGHRPEDPAGGEPVRRWAPSTRVRVRARNVLRRWAAAQADPRLSWVDPLAPAGNFAIVAWALARLRACRAAGEQVELTDDDLDELWQSWLRAFAGTGQGDGWLDRLDTDTREHAAARLPRWMPEIVAALCWLVIRRGPGLRARTIDFQPVLAAALDSGLVEPTDTTAAYLSIITRQPITCAQADAQLLEAIGYIDDDLWCARTAAELDLDELSLHAPPGAAAVSVRLEVGGIADPLADPRVPRLIVAVRRYRRCDGVALFAADGSWRLSFESGKTIAYLPSRGGDTIESAMLFDGGILEELVASAHALADMFPPSERAA